VSMNIRTITVLARRDVLEAMRVAAGITIFGHQVNLVLMRELPKGSATQEQLELLELADIEPTTTLADQSLPQLATDALCQVLTNADVVLSI